MIKLDIINEVVGRTGITKTKAEMAVETVFETMKKALKNGDRIELRGFGIFNVRPQENRDRQKSTYRRRSGHPAWQSGTVQTGKRAADAAVELMAKPGLADRIQLLVSSSGRAPSERILEDQGQVRSPEPRRLWLHITLLWLTFLSTTVFGYALNRSFRMGTGLKDQFVVSGYRLLFGGDSQLLVGCAYSVPLILILLAHELGHYITCRRWGVSATLPFFGPSPTLLGTIGAFIWVKSPIYRTRSLFDIGISGPDRRFRCCFAVSDRWSGFFPNLSRRPGKRFVRLRDTVAAASTRIGAFPWRTCFRYLLAPHRDGGLGRAACDRHQPAAGRPTGWRAHRLRTFR